MIDNPDNKTVLIHSCYSTANAGYLGFAYPSSLKSIVVNASKNEEYTVNYLLL